MPYKEIAKAIILEIAFMTDIEECKVSERGNLTREDFYYDNVDPDALPYELRGRV